MSDASAIRSALRAWYRTQSRELPWRDSDDPYAVWVSEVMLQQTRVATVIPYFEAWMAEFPDVAALAEADEEEVLKAWQGLGYYRRARHLHAAAQQVVDRFGGSLPADERALRSLPGVGEYTAGAILSIAFDVSAPAVDGNQIRVLSRIFAIAGDPGRAKTRRAIRDVAREVVRGPEPGEVNQALMDLGATVCTPTSPACLICPVRAHCAALEQGRVEQLPELPARTKAPTVHRICLLARSDDGRWLVARRAASGILAGFWEMPLIDGPISTPAEVAEAAERSLGLRFAQLELRSDEPVVHVLTHRRFQIAIADGILAEGSVGRANERYDALRLVQHPGEADLPLSALSKKLARRLPRDGSIGGVRD